MAEAGKEQAGLALPGGGAAQWPLQRYGRFMPSGTGEPPGPGQDAGAASYPTWKVFDSNEESGYLVLTIVISGHFFISQGQTLLEGFSLIGGKNWLKIVRRTDCLLFGTTIKRNSLPMVGKTASVGVRVVMGNFIQTDLGNESKTSRKTEQNKSRMFRVQFGGGSKEQALEHCGSCVQKLAQYVTVQVPDRVSQELGLSPGPLRAGESRAQHVPPQQGPPQNPEKPQPCGPASTSASGGRSSVSSLAQSLLVSEARPPVCEQSAWDAEELGPFLRLCLMDQNFPAFVEEVEKELKKLTGLRN